MCSSQAWDTARSSPPSLSWESSFGELILTDFANRQDCKQIIIIIELLEPLALI